MDWIDKKTISQLETRVRNFKWVNPSTANLSCPICGDSTTDNRKARGYIISKKGSTYYFCHNCGAAQPLGKFLEQVDTNLASEYRLEKFKESKAATKSQVELEDNIFKTNIKTPSRTSIDLPKLTSLPEDHPARQYIRSRLQNEKRFYYADQFPKWASTEFRGMANWVKVTQHPRIVLPVYDANKNLAGAIARSFQGESPKYAIMKLTEDDLVFGLDRVNYDRKIWVVEGPYDSLLLDNSVAAMTASLTRIKLPPNANAVFVHDNQPRNPEIVKLVEKTAFSGFPLVVWPDSFTYKDINDAVMNGIRVAELEQIMTQYTYKGLEARMKVSQWKKIS